MHPTRIFKSPEELEKAWIAFKDSLADQAKNWPKVQYVGKNGQRVEDYPIMPFTLEGFKRFCRNNYGDAHHYFVNSDNLYNDFSTICHAIKEEIREQQIIGGLLGFYNPSITQRLNGLTEKQENTVTANVIHTTLDLGNEIPNTDTPTP